MTDEPENEEDVVGRACRGLELAVERLLERYEKRKQKTVPETVLQRAKKLIDHSQDLLETLNDKRQSLRAMLEWFRSEWTRVASTSSSNSSSMSALESHSLPVLQHFIQVFLRCQDGLVLLTSGECRHPGDIREAQKKRTQKQHNFSSQLHTLEKRNDGYTSLYRSDAIYSGLSFDEFAIETVGIQARLTKLLAVCQGGNQSRTWEYLVNHGGQGVETLLDQHETDIKELQQQLQDMKKMIMRDVQQRLQPQKLTFVTHDKTERLVIILPTNHHSQQQKIVLERRADSFQIQDAKGVLPRTHKSPEDWSRVMPLMLPATTNSTQQTKSRSSAVPPPSSKILSSGPSTLNDRRRRRVIEDSDSEEESKVKQLTVKRQKRTEGVENQSTVSMKKSQATMPSVNGGLVVKVEIAKPQKQEAEESVAAIKAQMGASAEGLETAREELEQETAVSGSIGTGQDGMYDQDAEAIRRGKLKIQRLLSILKQIKSRSQVDDNEVWDARECLREAYMSAGNDLLWSSNATTRTNDVSKSSTSSSRLQEALQYFGLAGDLVREQQAAQTQLAEGTNDALTPESRFVQRNLLMLQGQASVNRGIALVEWSQLDETKPALKKRHQEQAVQELKAAQAHATDMRRRAKRDQEQFGPSSTIDWVDCMLDILKADQLESLASRWMGVSLWRVRKQQDAVMAFDKATSFYFSRPLPYTKLQNHPNLLQIFLEVGAECIYGCCTLADLACTAMENLKGSTTEQHAKGDALLAIVERVLEKQAQICGAMETLKSRSSLLSSAVQIFQEESEIQREDDIRESLREVQTWWSQTKLHPPTSLDQLSSLSDRPAGAPLPRSDLFGHSGQGAANNDRQGPTRRFIVTEGSQRSKHRRPGQVPATTSSRRNNHRNAPNDAVHALHFEDDDDTNRNNRHRPIRFRKWGDELLPQIVINKETGETGPKIVYPTLAPEMPPEIRAILQDRA